MDKHRAILLGINIGQVDGDRVGGTATLLILVADDQEVSKSSHLFPIVGEMQIGKELRFRMIAVTAFFETITDQNALIVAFKLSLIELAAIIFQKNAGRYIWVNAHSSNEVRRTVPSEIFDAITLQEARLILEAAGMDVPDVPNTQRYRVWRDLFTKLEPDFAHCAMVDTLKKTRDLKPLQYLLEDIPESLHSASLTARLRRKDQRRLVEALQTPVRQALCWG